MGDASHCRTVSLHKPGTATAVVSFVKGIQTYPDRQTVSKNPSVLNPRHQLLVAPGPERFGQLQHPRTLVTSVSWTPHPFPQ